MKRTALKPDPEKVRAWMRRSRLKAAVAAQERPRKELKRKRREKQREGPLSPHEWFLQVAGRSNWRCAVTRAKANSRFDRRFECHHIIPKDRLKKHGLHMKLWDPRNGMYVAQRVHVAHTEAFERIPRSALPSSAWAFAAECGPWAERYLEERYA